MTTWGYIRVSSKEQNVDRQVEQILPLVTTKSHLIIEKKSGKDFERPKYLALKDIMNEHDTLIIKSLDRLGRNYSMIKNEWKDLQDRKIYIKVLDNEILDTSKFKDNDLMAQFISNIVLEVLSFGAEKERIDIHQRQAEGIQSALKRGVKFGRPNVKFPDDWNDYYPLWKKKEITAVEMMNALNLKKTTFYHFLNE